MSLDQAVRFNCYNLSTIDDRSDVIDWTLNNSSDTIIESTAYPYLTELIYTQFNATHYQWGGPMLLIAEYFAKWTNVKYN